MLLDTGVIVDRPRRDAGGWTRLVDGAVSVPPTLEGVLQARLDALTDAERTTAQQAAVVGHVFWDSAVLAIGGTPRDLVTLQRKGLVVERSTSTLRRGAGVHVPAPPPAPVHLRLDPQARSAQLPRPGGGVVGGAGRGGLARVRRHHRRAPPPGRQRAGRHRGVQPGGRGRGPAGRRRRRAALRRAGAAPRRRRRPAGPLAARRHERTAPGRGRRPWPPRRRPRHPRAPRRPARRRHPPHRGRAAAGQRPEPRRRAPRRRGRRHPRVRAGRRHRRRQPPRSGVEHRGGRPATAGSSRGGDGDRRALPRHRRAARRAGDHAVDPVLHGVDSPPTWATESQVEALARRVFELAEALHDPAAAANAWNALAIFHSDRNELERGERRQRRGAATGPGGGVGVPAGARSAQRGVRAPGPGRPRTGRGRGAGGRRPRRAEREPRPRGGVAPHLRAGPGRRGRPAWPGGPRSNAAATSSCRTTAPTTRSSRRPRWPCSTPRPATGRRRLAGLDRVLAASPLPDGLEAPIRIQAQCYRALELLGDDRAAAVLAAAHAAVEALPGWSTDPEARRRHLAVAWIRALDDAWERSLTNS